MGEIIKLFCVLNGSRERLAIIKPLRDSVELVYVEEPLQFCTFSLRTIVSSLLKRLFQMPGAWVVFLGTTNAFRINLTKSDVVFSRNVDMVARSTIMNIMSIKQEMGYTKYLGLPLIYRRKKADLVFALLALVLLMVIKKNCSKCSCQSSIKSNYNFGICAVQSYGTPISSDPNLVLFP